MIERLIKVGDTVRLSFGFADRSGEGDYEIIRVMPARESGERHYRVRGIDGRKRRSVKTRSSFQKQRPNRRYPALGDDPKRLRSEDRAERRLSPPIRRKAE